MKRHVSRHRFLWSATGALSAAVVPVRDAWAQAEMKAAVSVPVEHPTYVWTNRMWEAVKKETGGRVAVRTFPNSQLGGQDTILSQVRLGAVQFLNIASSTYSSLVPLVEIELLPFIFNSNEQAWRVMNGPLGAYVRQQFAQYGLFPFPRKWDVGERQLASATRPIRNVADLANLKLMVPISNLYVDFWKTLGTSPVPVPANAWYTTLQTHIADAVDSALLTTETFRLYEVQKYISITNHIWNGGWLVANLQLWNSFPPDVQQIILRNEAKYAEAECRDVVVQSNSLADKLLRRGMTMNTADDSGMRNGLASFYGRYKEHFGNTAWALLEQGVGRKLG